MLFGFGKKNPGAPEDSPQGNTPPGETSAPKVSTKLCTDKLKGAYPHVGLLDCKASKVWIARPLDGQAIRTSHARLITGADNNTGVVWKDRFLCFWLYTPETAPPDINGYPVDSSDAHLIVRIDPHWDYDRQRLVPPELSDQVENNLERQTKHGERIFRWYLDQPISFPLALHLVAHRLAESRFYVKRFEPQA